MGLTKLQQTIWERSRAVGTGAQGIVLSEPTCAYLVGTVVADLGLDRQFPEVSPGLTGFFDPVDLDTLVLNGVSGREMFERLVSLVTDADTYYACLASLHKARLKYEMILRMQPIPTIEQVGPRGLLQYGKLSAGAVAAFLFWRKWFFDIDNRAGQETGYLFEPIIAYAIGGVPIPANKSPVKRSRDRGKGRQVDCLLGKKAYEFKIRVTIAASGQGRWREELDFPLDCRQSGFTPVLVVIDSTPNSKLLELAKTFRSKRGEVYIGEEAWRHLNSLAGPTMSRFLEKYVRGPLDRLIAEASDKLPEISARMDDDGVSIRIGDEVLHIDRQPGEVNGAEGDELPEDVADDLPG